VVFRPIDPYVITSTFYVFFFKIQKNVTYIFCRVSNDVEMLGSGIAMWQICCTTSSRIVVSLSVGGVVQHVRSRCPCVDCGVWQ